MRGIQIRDLKESSHFLAVDLHDILDLFSERTIQSNWRASEVWATTKGTSNAAKELEKLADGQTFISGADLNSMAHNVTQVIDGKFSAFENDNSPWIIIHALDSSLYEVFSPDHAVLDKVRVSFQKVSDCRNMDPV